MIARTTHYRMLWHAAMGQSHRCTHAVFVWSTAVATILIGTLAWAAYGPLTSLAWGSCVLAIMLLFAWSTVLVPGVVTLNSPARARLVPGLNSRLRELTALVWIGAMVLATAGLTWTMAQPGFSLMWVILFSLGLGMGMAGLGTAGYLILGAWLVYLVKDWLPASLMMALGHPWMPLLVLVALVPVGTLAAWAVLPRGGERHWTMVAAHERWVAAGKGRQGYLGALPGWLRRWPVGAARRRDPGTLLLQALGPDPRAWTLYFVLIGSLLFALLVTLVRKYAALNDDMVNWRTTSNVMLLFLFEMGTIATLMARTAGEQALLRLAPAIPGERTRFNRLLAHAQLRQALGVWAITSGGALLLAWVTAGWGRELVAQAGLCCMTLPALALVLRDHARRPRIHMFILWLAAAMLSLVGLVAGALGAALFGAPPVATGAVVGIVLAVVLVGWRLRRTVSLPFALPAARFD